MCPCRAERAVSKAAAEYHLPLVVGQQIVLHRDEHLASDLQVPGADTAPRCKDDVVLGGRKAPPSRWPALDLELNELIGATIVEPVHNPPGLDLPGRRVIDRKS